MWIFDLLFPPREDELLVRDATLEDFLAKLAPETIGAGGFSAATLLPFPDPLVRAAIHEAKYRGNEKAFALLAAVLAEYLRDFASDSLQQSELVLIPVPLGSARRKERGFNQVEEVVRRALKYLNIETNSDGLPSHLASDMLVRTRDTVTQVSLSRRERLMNMRNAFACPAKLGERSGADEIVYIVLDDVLTTGATLAAACAALRAAGAENVLAIAFAH